MIPLVSQKHNYFLLLLEAKKNSFIPREIHPVITNDIDLRSEVRDVGFVIPIETISLNQIDAAPAPLIAATTDDVSNSILSGDFTHKLDFDLPSLSGMEEFDRLQSKVIDEQFFPTQSTSFPLPIFIYDDTDITSEVLDFSSIIPSSISTLISIPVVPLNKSLLQCHEHISLICNSVESKNIPLSFLKDEESMSGYLVRQLTEAFMPSSSPSPSSPSPSFSQTMNPLHKYHPSYMDLFLTNDMVLPSDLNSLKFDAFHFQPLALQCTEPLESEVSSYPHFRDNKSMDNIKNILNSFYPEVQEFLNNFSSSCSMPFGSFSATGAANPHSIARATGISFATTLSELSESMGWLRAIEVETEFQSCKQPYSLHLDLDLNNGLKSGVDIEKQIIGGGVSDDVRVRNKRHSSEMLNHSINNVKLMQSILTPCRLMPLSSINSISSQPVPLPPLATPGTADAPGGGYGSMNIFTPNNYLKPRKKSRDVTTMGVDAVLEALLPPRKKRRFDYIDPSSLPISSNTPSSLQSCLRALHKRHPHAKGRIPHDNWHAPGSFQKLTFDLDEVSPLPLCPSSSSPQLSAFHLGLVTSLSRVLLAAQNANLPVSRLPSAEGKNNCVSCRAPSDVNQGEDIVNVPVHLATRAYRSGTHCGLVSQKDEAEGTRSLDTYERFSSLTFLHMENPADTDCGVASTVNETLPAVDSTGPPGSCADVTCESEAEPRKDVVVGVANDEMGAEAGKGLLADMRDKEDSMTSCDTQMTTTAFKAAPAATEISASGAVETSSNAIVSIAATTVVAIMPSASMGEPPRTSSLMCDQTCIQFTVDLEESDSSSSEEEEMEVVDGIVSDGGSCVDVLQGEADNVSMSVIENKSLISQLPSSSCIPSISDSKLTYADPTSTTSSTTTSTMTTTIGAQKSKAEFPARNFEAESSIPPRGLSFLDTSGMFDEGTDLNSVQSLIDSYFLLRESSRGGKQSNRPHADVEGQSSLASDHKNKGKVKNAHKDEGDGEEEAFLAGWEDMFGEEASTVTGANASVAAASATPVLTHAWSGAAPCQPVEKNVNHHNGDLTAVTTSSLPVPSQAPSVSTNVPTSMHMPSKHPISGLHASSSTPSTPSLTPLVTKGTTIPFDAKASTASACMGAEGVSSKAGDVINDMRLAGLVVLMSEELFVHQPLCPAVLSQRHGVKALGRALEYPLDCIVDEVTGVSVIPEYFLLQGGNIVKQYLKLLTKLAFKFDTIWVLILKYTEPPALPDAQKTSKDIVDPAIIHVSQLNSACSSFYQALSQFSLANCLVQTRVVAQEASLPAQLYSICQETADTATVQCNMLLSTFLHRPFLMEDESIDEAVLEAHCEFLQLFPTINYYVAAELLSLCPLKQLAHLPPIPAFLQELAVWETGPTGSKGVRKGCMAATLGRSATMLNGFHTLLNRKFRGISH